MHPAVTLTLTLFMTLTIGMPIVGWLMTRQYHDRRTKTWFLAIIFDSLQIPMVAMQASYPGWATYVVPSIISVMFYIVIWLVLRLERGPVRHFWGKVLMGGMLYTVLSTMIYQISGRSPLLIYTFNNLVYLMLALVITIEALRVGHQQRSMGMAFVALGFAAAVAGYGLRAYWHLVLHTAIPVFEFSPAANFLVLTQALNLMLMTFGYLGFIRDKSEVEKLKLISQKVDADARRQESEKYSRELLHTIEERDRMVMVNSRFLNLGALAVFNSAIVHEISQPLQAAMMCLDNAQAEDQRRGGPLAAELNEAAQMLGKTGEIVTVLRQMKANNKGLAEHVDAIAQIRAILPIVQGDARSRQIQLDCQLPEEAFPVNCSGVMLQRLLLNFVANAFDAFKIAKTVKPWLSISAETSIEPYEPHRTGIAIVIQDNGPGVTAQELDMMFKPFATNKADGLGVGLSLAQILLRKWGGYVDAINNDVGMKFTIWLPLHQTL